MKDGQTLKERFWAKIYRWSLNEWRKSSPDPNLKRTDGKLSSHALVRYIERVQNIDVDKITAEIMSEQALEKIKEIGGTGKFVVNNIQYVVFGGIIVTVYPHQKGKPYEVKYKPDGTKIMSF